MELRPKLDSTSLRVFISYRGKSSKRRVEQLTAQIRERLPLAYPFAACASERENGKPWKEELRKAIFLSNAFIAVLDEDWADEVQREDSVVRWETEAALRSPNIQTRFVFRLPNVKAPDPDDLPLALRPLFDDNFTGDDDAPPKDEEQVELLLSALATTEKDLLEANTMPIALISSALTSEGTDQDKGDTLPFFSLVVTDVVQEAAQAAFPMNVVVKIPRLGIGSRGIANSQRAILRTILADASRYRAIILNPFNPYDLLPFIRRFRERHPQYPLFTIDQCFGAPPWSAAQCDDGDLPAGVMCDWELGGKIAAKMIIAHLAAVDVKEPLLWIFTGITWTRAREDGFLRELEDEYGSKVQHETFQADFRQDEARNHVLRTWERTHLLPHAIFCTNDEMALGVHEALEQLSGRTRMSPALTGPDTDPTFGIKVVGFDAIHDVTTRISPPNDLSPKVGTFFLNTVDVRIHEQANAVVGMVQNYLHDPHEQPSPRIHLIKPKWYVTPTAQAARTRAEIAQFGQLLDEYRKPRRSTGQ